MSITQLKVRHLTMQSHMPIGYHEMMIMNLAPAVENMPNFPPEQHQHITKFNSNQQGSFLSITNCIVLIFISCK